MADGEHQQQLAQFGEHRNDRTTQLEDAQTQRAGDDARGNQADEPRDAKALDQFGDEEHGTHDQCHLYQRREVSDSLLELCHFAHGPPPGQWF